MKSYSAAIAVNKNLQFMQYTLSTLLSSFPWTTQKSIIVENSKIVENFGATIFSTIMEFDCTQNLKVSVDKSKTRFPENTSEQSLQCFE